MTEKNEPKEKKVLLTIGNARIKEYDNLNHQVEAYETYYNPKAKEETSGWRFKGYCHSILGGLQLIQRKELLIDKNAVSDLKSYLNAVQESNEQLKEAVAHE